MEEGGEAQGRTRVGVRELEGRKLGGGWEIYEGVGMRKGEEGMEGEEWRREGGTGG